MNALVTICSPGFKLPCTSTRSSLVRPGLIWPRSIDLFSFATQTRTWSSSSSEIPLRDRHITAATVGRPLLSHDRLANRSTIQILHEVSSGWLDQRIACLTVVNRFGAVVLSAESGE